MSDLNELLRDLEAATEGSAELGGRIICAVRGWEFNTARDSSGGIILKSNAGHNWYRDPSRSIDAAVSLVPEGEYFKVGCDRDGIGYASYGSARIYEGATPALALSIAVLRSMKK